MRKFFVALTITLTVALTLTLANFAEAAQFTQDQFEQMVTTTVQNPAAASKNTTTLPINVTTFQNNYNAFMTNFISQTNATGEDATMMQKIFLITEPKIFTKDDETLFAQNFLNKSMIIGLSNNGSNFKVLTFFAVQSDEREDLMVNVLVLNAFVKGITPDYDSTALLDDIGKSSDATVVHNGVKYTVSKVGNLNVVTAVAN